MGKQAIQRNTIGGVIGAIKKYVFGSKSVRLTEEKCEQFFADENYFNCVSKNNQPYAKS